ncbi:zinc ABC transporter substrate-binding protein [soil metagenome]
MGEAYPVGQAGWHRQGSKMKPRLRLRAFALVAVIAMVLASCGTDAAENGDGGGREINVVATTGMIADAVRNVGGDRVDVTGLMGPGVDPHLYRPTASDVSVLENADIIFYNGLELEGRMTDIFVRLAASKPTVAVTAGLPEDRLQEPPEFDGKYDPHIWFDVDLWSLTIQNVQRQLAELDPDSAEIYQANADSYIAELQELDSYVQEQIDTIPEPGRILITAHDAFGYFGRRYGVEVIGLQGTSTAAEAGAADVQNLSRLIVERQIKAIFVESSVPRATIEAVQSAVEAGGHDVAIGGELFSDAMGADGTPEGTYIGMVRHNVDTIAGALR